MADDHGLIHHPLIVSVPFRNGRKTLVLIAALDISARIPGSIGRDLSVQPIKKREGASRREIRDAQFDRVRVDVIIRLSFDERAEPALNEVV
jgi:hypothetical protein